MEIINTKLAGLKVIIPKVWEDKRGYFFETYHEKKYKDAGIRADFVQDNEAMSSYGVIRGLHYQLPPYTQAKLVKVTQGEVLDVVVDIRPDSETYGHTFSLILNDINKKQLFVPAGFAHGYAVLSQTAIFCYKCDQFYHPESEAGLQLDDEQLKINWIIPEEDRIISDKDRRLPPFGQHKPWK